MSSSAGHNKDERVKAEGTREELDAILSARQELGAEYNEELTDMLIERLDTVIDRRVEARLQNVKPKSVSPAVPISSLVFAIPATVIVLDGGAGVLGVGLVWAAIVVINVFYSGKKISDIL